MHPTVLQQARRSLWRMARWQSQLPARVLAHSLLTQSLNASTHAVSANNDILTDPQPQLQERKTTTSNKSFNLMNTHSLGRDAAQTSGSSSAAWKRSTKKNRFRRKKGKGNKWWADMDRVSFRVLLTEEMGSNKVSSVLRKYMNEFPILNNNWSDQELVMIVCTLIKMNRSEMALEVLRNQIKEPDRDRVNRVAAASARMGNAQVALGVLEIANHFNLAPDVITFTSAIHACARSGKYDVPMALNLLNEMISANVQPNARTYGAMILAYARMDRWEEILELVNSIPYTDEAHKTEVFTCAIISCSRNRQHHYASRLFELLLEDGVYPGDNVCNAALSSCARTPDVAQLRRIFKLVENHATPSTYSYNCMISAYGNARSMDKALKVFESMQNEATIAPDIVTFNSLLLAAVRSRRLDMFPFILSLINEAGIKWDAITLNILLEGCSLNGDIELAQYYWSQATQGKQPSADVSSEDNHHVTLDRGHFETLMAVYIAAGDYQAVVDLWQKSRLCRRRAKSSKSLNFLLRACEGLKYDKTAVAVLAEFADRGQPLSPIAHQHMLEVFLAADKYDAASAYLHKMMETDGLVSTFSFTVLMKYLAKNKRHSDVLAVFNLYLETCESNDQNSLLQYPTDAVYVLAMRSAVELEDHETVLAIYSGLPTTMSMAVHTELLVLAVSSCESEGDWRAAVTMYDEMTGRLDEDTNVEMYKHIVKIVASAGEFDRALDVGGGQWYRQNRPDQGWGL
ncbi:Pentatricopeptide repeat-containing protein 2 [Phytophthora infestans]|nr:Pentatricopeptide repeat-containing protein 2 [Phytophthora infestans]KAF4137041.1 PPR repeat family [Phytophthora infestans]